MPSQVRLSLRARLPVVWLLLLLAAAILLPGRVWTTLLVGLGGLVVVAYVWARQLARSVRGRRQLRFGWVAVGDRLSEQFEITNDSWLPAFWVEVVDSANVPGYQAGVVRSVGSRQTEHWRQDAVCQRRGQFQLGPWALHTGDPFGIFRVLISYPVGDEIIIHPPIHSQLPIPLPAGQSSGRTRTRERAWQATLNAASVRDYQPHDPYNRIHWPTTARRDQLFVRQFDLDAAGDIWLVLDLAAAVQLGEGAQSTEEHAVLLAASLGAVAHQQQRGVGLAGYGRQPLLLPPGRGQGQQWKLLHSLALVNADGQASLGRALEDLSQVVRRGAAAIIITPNDDAGWLPALLHLSQRGIRCQVVLLDRVSFGGGGNPAGMQQLIRHAGFTCYLVRQGEIGHPLQEEVRRGFWEFKTTPLGKVVVVKRPDGRN